MEPNAKRVRSANFSNEEKLQCLHLIKKYKEVIESKKTGAINWSEKEAAWKKIEEEFNSQSTVFRSVESVKRFYNNKKKETRKTAAEEKRSFRTTGGGKAVVKSTDPVFDLTLEIMNKRTVYGLSNNFDSDSLQNMVINYTKHLILYKTAVM
jgi:hypothetical protein